MNQTTRWTMMSFTLVATIGAMLPGSSPAYAQDSRHSFRSTTGYTTVPASAQGACKGAVVTYNTRYQGSDYQGQLWVNSPAGSDCEGGRSRTLHGYFEERGAGNEWCRGQLTVYLTQDRRDPSYIHWNSITAVPGHSCAGAGTTPTVSLSYSDR